MFPFSPSLPLVRLRSCACTPRCVHESASTRPTSKKKKKRLPPTTEIEFEKDRRQRNERNERWLTLNWTGQANIHSFNSALSSVWRSFYPVFVCVLQQSSVTLLMKMVSPLSRTHNSQPSPPPPLFAFGFFGFFWATHMLCQEAFPVFAAEYL